MTAIHRLTCIAIGTLALALPAEAQAQTNRALATVIAEIDQGFTCPQFRPDDAARRADMIAFSRAIASVGPNRISYRQAAYIHAKMLERHNCSQQQAMVASASPVVAQEPPARVNASAVIGASPPD